MEIEYFCRGCKGHYSCTTRVAALGAVACRCGATDLLVYWVSDRRMRPQLAS